MSLVDFFFFVCLFIFFEENSLFYYFFFSLHFCIFLVGVTAERERILNKTWA